MAKTTYTIFMLVRTTAQWLALVPKQRFAFLGSDVAPILRKHPEVRLRFFDAEAFTAHASDVLAWQTENLDQYQSVVESLRESKFWTTYSGDDFRGSRPTADQAVAQNRVVSSVTVDGNKSSSSVSAR